MASSASKTPFLKGRGVVWILSFAFALLAGFGVLTLVGSAAEQGTYYVINTDVPAGTELSDAVVDSRTANLDGVPTTALTIADLKGQPLFTSIPLRAGDVITSSVVTTGARIVDGIPADYVAASLEVDPANAAAGKIRAGDLVDIAAVSEQGESRVVLHGVLVIDVSVAPSTISRSANADSAADQEGPAIRDGVPFLYTFAVSPTDFATLALLRDKDVYLALTQGTPAESLDVIIREQDIFRSGPVSPATPPNTDNSAAPGDGEPTTDDTAIPVEPDGGAGGGAEPLPAPTPTP